MFRVTEKSNTKLSSAAPPLIMSLPAPALITFAAVALPMSTSSCAVPVMSSSVKPAWLVSVTPSALETVRVPPR